MSKSAGNVVDPWTVTEVHGADALRWLMFADGNPWVSRRVGDQQLDDVVRRFLLTIWNTHVFFTTYARIDGFDPRCRARRSERPVTDRWILAELADTIDVVDRGSGHLRRVERHTPARTLRRRPLELVRPPQPPALLARQRRGPQDKAPPTTPCTRASRPSHSCSHRSCRSSPNGCGRTSSSRSIAATARLGAPHRLPDRARTWQDDGGRAAMATGRRLVELGRQARTDSGHRVRQPLARALVSVPSLSRRDSHWSRRDRRGAQHPRRSISPMRDRSRRPSRCARTSVRSDPRSDRTRPQVAAALTALDSAAVETCWRRDGRGRDAGARRAHVRADARHVRGRRDAAHRVERRERRLVRGRPRHDPHPELELEGAARELVRAVNEHRKAIGLDLSDRIASALAFSLPTRAALSSRTLAHLASSHARSSPTRSRSATMTRARRPPARASSSGRLGSALVDVDGHEHPDVTGLASVGLERDPRRGCDRRAAPASPGSAASGAASCPPTVPREPVRPPPYGGPAGHSPRLGPLSHRGRCTGRWAAALWSAPADARRALRRARLGRSPTVGSDRRCLVATGVGGPLGAALRLVGAGANAIGQVVLCRSERPSSALLDHEAVHVRQAERLGPLLVPATCG
jgi:hypothetical protein